MLIYIAMLQEAIYQLLRLAGLLEALPLPPGSAQADLVAASISQKATLAERKVAFHILFCLDVGHADIPVSAAAVFLLCSAASGRGAIQQ